MRLRTDQHGFTLIELLTAIVIIGVLLSVAVGSYVGFRQRAASSAASANLRAVLPAIEAYFSDNGTYSGMTVAILAAEYDGAVEPGNLTLSAVTPTSYCVESTAGWATWSKNGPSAPMVEGPCP